MSQAFLICNLDKEERLDPTALDLGYQLVSLATSSRMAFAMAVLCASGSGPGTGEMCLPHVPILDTPPRGFTRGDDGQYRRTPNHDWTAAQLREVWIRRDRTPSPVFDIVGSWAGDRIVIAGETATDPHLLAARQRYRLREMQTVVSSGPYPRPIGLSVFFFAAYCCKDISAAVLDVFKAVMVYNLERRLRDLVTTKLTAALYASYRGDGRVYREEKVGKSTRTIFDLTWLAPADILDFMRMAETTAEQRKIKKWLSQQDLPTYGAAFMACVHGVTSDQEPRIDKSAWRHVCEEFALSDLDDLSDRHLLPSAPYLKAALALEREKTKQPALFQADRVVMAELAQRMGHRQERAIELREPS